MMLDGVTNIFVVEAQLGKVVGEPFLCQDENRVYPINAG